MANFVYIDKDFLKLFVSVLNEGEYPIKKYLPHIDEEWYDMVSECMNHFKNSSAYEQELSIYEMAAKILYKIAKRHELGDGNKRSAVIAVFCFCLVNECAVISPQKLKQLAKRIASTRGRNNEELIKRRVARDLESDHIIEHVPSQA